MVQIEKWLMYVLDSAAANLREWVAGDTQPTFKPLDQSSYSRDTEDITLAAPSWSHRPRWSVFDPIALKRLSIPTKPQYNNITKEDLDLSPIPSTQNP